MSISSPSPRGFYSVREAADRLHVHPESLLRAVRRGTIALQAHEAPAPRARRKYFFKRADVDKLSAR